MKLEHVLCDIDAKGVDVSDHQIRRNMAEFLAQAAQEISTEG